MISNDIKSLHTNNDRKMNSLINPDLKYEWSDPTIKGYFTGELREIHIPLIKDPDNKEIINEKEYAINRLIYKFNNRQINFNEFQRRITKKTKEIKALDSKVFLHGNFMHYIHRFTKRYRSLLLSGVGGIGKSHFLYEVTKTIEKRSPNRILTIYGKFNKNIKSIPWDKVYNLCNEKEFTVIIDAINEMTLESQQFCLKMAGNILKTKFGRIIISYRTKCIDELLKIDLEKVMINQLDFQGVSFESSVVPLIERFGSEFNVYEDLIDINNPLLLNMLHELLNTIELRQTKNKKFRSIASITYLYEHFIQRRTSKKHWELTKCISKWMYERNQPFISYSDLKDLLGNDLNDYLIAMAREGLITSSYSSREEDVYFFSYHRLNDYLIARSLLTDLGNKSNQEIISFINGKIDEFDQSLNEAYILVLFDKFKTNVLDAIEVIFESKLRNSFDAGLIKFIVFKNNKEILSVQENIIIENKDNFIKFIGGIPNKPFNFTNYFNKYLFENPEIILKFDFDFYLGSNIKTRLYNSLYSINYFDKDETYLLERFWFGFWMMSSPLGDIRDISMKLVFDIVSKYENYIDELIKGFQRVNDDYIKNGIIRILCSLSNSYKPKLEKFLLEVYEDKELVNAEVIYSISNYLFSNNEYIQINKCDYYKEALEGNWEVNKDVLNFLYDVEDDKNHLIKLDYHNVSDIRINNDFIYAHVNDENLIKFNNLLTTYFNCIFKGECQTMFYRNKLYKELNINLDKYEKLDSKKLYLVWQHLFLKYVNKYDVKPPYEYKGYDQFAESINNILWKCTMLATRDYFGTLMCNYYTRNSYSNQLNIKEYNPNEHDEYINLTPPISIYSDNVEKMDDKIVDKIAKTIPENRNKKWHDDLHLSLSNIKYLIEPIHYQGEEWVLIHGFIKAFEKDKSGIKLFSDDYLIGIAVDECYSLSKSYDKDREYTIDRRKYYGNFKDYKYSNTTICKEIPNVTDKEGLMKNNSMMLPPSLIIQELDLKYDNKTSSWLDNNEEKVIICNNNAKSWYDHQVVSSLYLRKDAYIAIKEKYSVKFFGFTERLIKDKGYSHESSIQIEFTNNEILNWYKHYKNDEQVNWIDLDCSKCDIYVKNREENRRKTESFNSLIEKIEEDLDITNKSSR